MLLLTQGDGNNDGNITLKSNSKIYNLQKLRSMASKRLDVIANKRLMQSQGTLQMYGAQASCQSASSRYGQRGTSQKHQLRRRINYGMDK